MDAESALLGAILAAGSGVDLHSLGLESNHFSQPNRHIWEAIIELDSEGKPYDMISVIDELERTGKLKAAGGRTRVMQLLKEAAPTVAILPHYAGIVKRASLMEKLRSIGEYIYQSSVSADTDPEVIVTEALDSLEGLLKGGNPDAVEIGTSLDAWLNRVKAQDTLSFPWEHISRIAPVIYPGDVVLVGGRPGSGKSSLLIRLAYDWSLQDKVLFVSLEMTAEQIYERLLATVSRIPILSLRDREYVSSHTKEIQEAAELIKSLKLYVVDQHDITPARLKQLVRKIEPKVLVLDYVQLLNSGRKFSKRYEEISYISRKLKVLSVQEHIITVAAVQLNREVEKRNGEPILADIRDSSALEADADLVMFVWRDGGRMSVKIAKNRNGPLGSTILEFVEPLATVEDEVLSNVETRDPEEEMDVVPF